MIRSLHAVVALLLCLSCPCVSAVDSLRPKTELQGGGVSYLSPDEDGWIVERSVKQWSLLGKYAANKAESYSIQMTHIKAACPASKEAFIETVRRSLQTTLPRFKLRSTSVEEDKTGRAYARVNYYFLTEDYGAHKMPADQSYALLEAQGSYSCHPYDATVVEKAEYSYRYYPGDRDPNFKTNAQWVLDHVRFTGLTSR